MRRVKAAGPAASDADREFMRFSFLQLFSPALRFSTGVGLLFCVGTLLSIWTSNIWLPTIQSLMLQKAGITGAAAIPHIGNGMMLWGVGGIFGYGSFGFLADAFGRRATIVLFNVGAIASGLLLYLGLETYTWYPLVLPVFGYFVFGVFSGHAVYLARAVPDPCASHRRVVLQWIRPDHHQLRPIGRRAAGGAVRQFQQGGGVHDLLRDPQHRRDDDRARDAG